MCECSVFPVIDLPGTGRNIQRLRQQAGVTVRELQAYFGFEYPQAIYKWQHGECLPSVDNLLALARVLRVPMEDLLVYDDREVSYLLAARSNHSSCSLSLICLPRTRATSLRLCGRAGSLRVEISFWKVHLHGVLRPP